MFNIKELYIAESLDHAINLLDKYENTKIISGGTDVLINLRSNVSSSVELVSINGLKELRYVNKDEDGLIRIGATSTFSDIEKNHIIKEYLPVLAQGAASVGGPQIREVGTIGGNICNGATSADTATQLTVLNANLLLKSNKGERLIPITEFYTGPGKTVRKRDEVLVEIQIQEKDYSGFSGEYIKYAMRNAMDIATIATTAYVKLSDDKKIIEDGRISFGVAAPTPIRAKNTEKYLKNLEISEENINEIRNLVLKDVSPRDSWRASKSLREQIIKENAVRSLISAIEKEGGKINA